MLVTMTDESRDLFLRHARDAGNWSGTPLLNVTKEERGNLTQLKREGLLTTFRSDGCDFVKFTARGIGYALTNDIVIEP